MVDNQDQKIEIENIEKFNTEGENQEKRIKIENLEKISTDNLNQEPIIEENQLNILKENSSIIFEDHDKISD